MSQIVKKVKIKQADGTFSNNIDLGALASNVSMTNGNSVEEAINNINSAGYITKAVNDLTNYYNKTDMNSIIENLSTLDIQVVSSLPSSSISTKTIYLLASDDQENQNIYEEYIYVNNNWELIGTTQVDLSNYALKSEIVTYQISKSGSTITLSGSDGTQTQVTDSNTVVQPTSTIPKANGTAAVGSETTYARGDHVHPVQTTISGNAGSATKLATERTIALSGAAVGTATGFNGTKNITIPVTSLDASKLTGTASINTTGNANTATTATSAGTCTGNAATATKLANARSITLSGSVTGSTTFDGSANRTITTTLANASSTTVGGLKVRLDGTTLYITNDGSNA